MFKQRFAIFIADVITTFRVKILKDPKIMKFEFDRFNVEDKRTIYIVRSKYCHTLFKFTDTICAETSAYLNPRKDRLDIIYIDETLVEELKITNSELQCIIGHEIGHLFMYDFIPKEILMQGLTNKEFKTSYNLLLEVMCDKISALFSHPSCMIEAYKKIDKYVKTHKVLTERYQVINKFRQHCQEEFYNGYKLEVNNQNDVCDYTYKELHHDIELLKKELTIVNK